MDFPAVMLVIFTVVTLPLESLMEISWGIDVDDLSVIVADSKSAVFFFGTSSIPLSQLEPSAGGT